MQTKTINKKQILYLIITFAAIVSVLLIAFIIFGGSGKSEGVQLTDNQAGTPTAEGQALSSDNCPKDENGDCISQNDDSNYNEESTLVRVSDPQDPCRGDEDISPECLAYANAREECGHYLVGAACVQLISCPDGVHVLESDDSWIDRYGIRRYDCESSGKLAGQEVVEEIPEFLEYSFEHYDCDPATEALSIDGQCISKL